ncbi:hypothetical protein ACIPYS_09835 [Kitasatospora sp. NPDC089913]|uniref:hypothetical protein n=1 Tax=Kitasatospora sp. NPDC089913 TaxID=3364080 RepID=UPI003808F2C3
MVSLSSLDGSLAQPTLSAYCAGRVVVRGFGEALRSGLPGERLPVRVGVVRPGGAWPGIATAGLWQALGRGLVSVPAELDCLRVCSEGLLRMPALQAARIAVGGVEAGAACIRGGFGAGSAGPGRARPAPHDRLRTTGAARPAPRKPG